MFDMNSDVVRIGSCILACDMACMVRFYRDTLGLQTDWDGGNFAEFKTASGPVSFWLYSRKEFVKAFGEAYVPPKGMNQSFELVFGFRHMLTLMQNMKGYPKWKYLFLPASR